jgi:hypothetical protein
MLHVLERAESDLHRVFGGPRPIVRTQQQGGSHHGDDGASDAE